MHESVAGVSSDTPLSDRAIEKSVEEGVYVDARMAMLCRDLERRLSEAQARHARDFKEHQGLHDRLMESAYKRMERAEQYAERDRTVLRALIEAWDVGDRELFCAVALPAARAALAKTPNPSGQPTAEPSKATTMPPEDSGPVGLGPVA